MIISFGWTAQYLPPNGPKSCTRRIWKPRTIAAWQKAWDDRRIIHDAVDKCLSYGGKRIGKLELLERPYQQRLGDMPPDDLIREGGMCESVDEFIDRYFDGNADQMVTVVRFSLFPIPSPLFPIPSPLTLSPDPYSSPLFPNLYYD